MVSSGAWADLVGTEASFLSKVASSSWLQFRQIVMAFSVSSEVSHSD